MAIARLQPSTVSVMVAPSAPNVVPVLPHVATAGSSAIAADTSVTPDPDKNVLIGAVIATVAGLVIATLLSATIWDPGPLETSAVVTGLSIFGLLYATTQALERLLEPFTYFIIPTAKKAADRDQKLTSYQKSRAELDGQAAARAQAELDKRRANRTIMFWSIATILGMFASGWLKLYLPKTIGIETAPRLAQILLTGLVIGGGTKPLHDLITRIEKAKTTAQDPPETR